MKATHKLPAGKYYGTEVTFNLGDDDIVEFTVWKSTDPAPSKRQLEAWGMTLKEAKADAMISDSHFESETAFNICEEICRRFNREWIESIRENCPAEKVHWKDNIKKYAPRVDESLKKYIEKE